MQYPRPALRVICAVSVFALCLTTGAVAQQRTYTLADLVELVKGGVPPERVLDLANKNCVDFERSSSSDSQLTRAGASKMFIAALHSTCRKTRETRSPVEPRRAKTAVKKREPATNVGNAKTTLRTLLEHDYGIEKDALEISDPNCLIHNESTGYVMNTLTATGLCGTLWNAWIPPSVTITAAFTDLGGLSAYSYGISFGQDTIAKVFYTFQINDRGEYTAFKSSNTWEVLIPNTKSVFIKQGPSARNSLQVSIRGHRMTFSVNGHEVDHYVVENAPSGQVGVGIFDHRGVAHVRLDTIIVKEIP